MSEEKRRDAPPKPLMWRSVHAVDRVTSPVLGGLTRHEMFGLLVSIGDRGRRGVLRRTERLSRRLLHAVNLPAASDVNRLLREIASIEHKLRTLTNEMTDRRADQEGPRADDRT